MNKLNLIAKFIKKNKAKSVLDLGCYNLRQYEAIKKTGHKINYFGVDAKENCWENYKNDKQVTLSLQDVNFFLLKNKKKFDVIIYSGMFDWLGDKEEMFGYNSFETLNSIKNNMHDGSVLIIVTANNGLGRRILNCFLGSLSNVRYMVDRKVLSKDLERLNYLIIDDLYLPWETKFLEWLRKIFFIGKWANNEIIFICKRVI